MPQPLDEDQPLPLELSHTLQAASNTCSPTPEELDFSKRPRKRVVAFYRICPHAEPIPSFPDGRFPLDEVLETVCQLDPAAAEYRFVENLFGNERFCLVDRNGPIPLLCLYTKDVTAAPETERKGEIRSVILEPDEGIVDASYAIVLPKDVVALVRTSNKAPGAAFLADWLSSMSGYGFYLSPLPNPTVNSRLSRVKSTIRKMRFAGPVKTIQQREYDNNSVARQLRGLLLPGADVVTIEASNRLTANRIAFADAVMRLLDDMGELLPELTEASVWITGHDRPIKLDGLHLKTEMEFGVNEHRRITARTAVDGLLGAYEREQEAIETAEGILRQRYERRP